MLTHGEHRVRRVIFGDCGSCREEYRFMVMEEERRRIHGGRWAS